MLAAGRDSREHLPYRPVALMAQRLGTTVVDFPGGHLGSFTHAAEFAEVLARRLRADSPVA